jgi:hypothetical protein
MSHNRHFSFGPSMAAAGGPQSEGEAEGRRVEQMGNAYAPQAEGEAESLRVYEMGNAYAEDSQGAAESERVVQLGDINPNSAESFRAHFHTAKERASMRGIQPGCMVSNGRIGDVREEWFGAHPMMRGLREEDSNLALRGLREQDSDLRMSGLREQDADLTMRGLREEDASLHLSATGYRGNEMIQEFYRGMGGSEDNEMLPASSRILMSGLREEDSSLKLSGVQGMRAAIMLRGLRESDAALTLRGLREDDAKMSMKGMGYIRHVVDLEKYRAMGEQNMMDFKRMGAADFHRRFPCEVAIQGVGHVHMSKDMAKVAGVFDFLKANPTWEEFVGRAKVVLGQWNPIKARLQALPDQQKAAVSTQMAAMDRVGPSDFDQLNDFIMDPNGYALHATGRTHQLERLETALPTINKIVAQMEQLGPAASLKQETNRATNTALKDVNGRLANTKPDILHDYVLPIGVGGALVTGLVLIFA